MPFIMLRETDKNIVLNFEVLNLIFFIILKPSDIFGLYYKNYQNFLI